MEGEICFEPAPAEALLGDKMKKRKVKVDGEEYEVELEKQEGVWNVSIDGKIFSIEIEGGSVEESSDSKRKKKGRGKKSGTISSTIPGKIVSIAVEEGANVVEGDVVMILEAMKMQNEIQAPVAGTITEIHCEEGQSIEANVPLLVITPEETDDES